MRRMNWKTVSTLVTMVVVAGCQENVASPELQNSSSAPARLALAPQGRPDLSLNTLAATNGSTDFTVSPNGSLFQIWQKCRVLPGAQHLRSSDQHLRRRSLERQLHTAA